MNAVRFHTLLMRRYYAQPQLAARLLTRIPPSASINAFTSSEAHKHLLQLSEEDAEVGALLCAHVDDLAADCHATCPPQRYVRENARTWRALHRRLRPLAYCQPTALRPPVPYLFDDLLALLAEESPGLSLQSESELCGINTPATACGGAASYAASAEEIISHLHAIIGGASADLRAISADTPVMEAGLESFGAIELRSQLQALVGDATALPATLVFDHPSARSLAAFLSGSSSGGGTHSAGFVAKRRMILAERDDAERGSTLGGLALRAPRGTRQLEELENLRRSGADSVSLIPSTRWAHSAARDSTPDGVLAADCDHAALATRYGGFMLSLDLFDGAAFRLPQAEALSMDPQQRLLLEYGYSSLHAAAIGPGGQGMPGQISTCNLSASGSPAFSLAGLTVGIHVGVQAIDHLHATLSSSSALASVYAAGSQMRARDAHCTLRAAAEVVLCGSRPQVRCEWRLPLYCERPAFLCLGLAGPRRILRHGVLRCHCRRPRRAPCLALGRRGG